MRHFHPWDLLPLARDIFLILAGGSAGTLAWFKSRRAQSWLSTQGTVSSTVSRNAGGVYKPWIAEFIYSYTVNGEYFSGFHPVRVWTRKRADDLLLGWKGRMLIVRYSPSSHETSALLKSDQPGGHLGN
jgi:hypothetical protein